MSAILGLIAASLIADFWIYFGVSVDFDASSAVFALKPRLALIDFLAGPLRYMTYKDLFFFLSSSTVSLSFWMAGSF